MKRTTVVLDERLLAQAKRVTGIKTTRGVVDYALRDVIRLRHRAILRLRGNIGWRGDLAVMRRGRGWR